MILHRSVWPVFAVLLIDGSISMAQETRESVDVEARAIAYLVREVPRWRGENQCFSCHNNGDAARALYQAARLGESIADEALGETTLWLARPEDWDSNGGDGSFSDKILARIQFASALMDAVDAGMWKGRDELARAAELLAGDQEQDGAWRVDAEGNIGSPATYGRGLATVVSRRILIAADLKRFSVAIDRADAWLRKAPVSNIPDAAAVLLGLESADDADAMTQRHRSLDLIRKGKASRGGWGPFVNAPAEPFDTAMVLLALAGRKDIPDRDAMIRHGRAFLISTQRPDGSWPETTRPPDGESYAQRLSTTGWVLQALLATRTEG